jgi:DNA mismatch repair protein MutS
LTELAERLPGAQNYRIRVAERDGEVIFLYKIERGRASKSYGIEVARLAGLPPQVLARAREVLTRLERYELDVFAEQGPAAQTPRAEAGPQAREAVPAAAQATPAQEADGGGVEGALGRVAERAGRRALAAQFTLFDSVNRTLLDELRGVDVETLTEAEAREILHGLKNRIV